VKVNGLLRSRRDALVALSALSASVLAGCESFGRLPIRTLDAPFIVTKEDVVEGMLRLAGVGPNDVVYDLGCGDGRIPIMAAQKFGARGVGVEIDTVLVKLARENAVKAGVANRVEFRLEDLFKTDVRPATVMALFLLPEMMERLKFTFRQQLRPGSRIVAHEFGMGGDWPPDRSVKVGSSTIHLWTVK
jgi:SAM-dependent methyltransferase